MNNQTIAWADSMTAMTDLSQDTIRSIEREAMELGKSFENASESLKRREEYMRYISDTSDEVKLKYEAFKAKEEKFLRIYEDFKSLIQELGKC